MNLRERFGVIGEFLFWLAILLAIGSVVEAYGMWQYGWLLPWQKAVERETVKQSASFVDSNNNQLENYKLEHARLDVKVIENKESKAVSNVYKAQQRAILDRMCREISTMNKDTVNPSTLSWLNSKGGCN